MKINYNRLTPLFLGMAVVALILAVIGIWDVSTSPYSGYRLGADYRVVRVDSGSPAAEAGVRVGDRITKIDRVSTERLYQLSKLSRAEIGEHQKLTLQRDGKRICRNGYANSVADRGLDSRSSQKPHGTVDDRDWLCGFQKTSRERGLPVLPVQPFCRSGVHLAALF